MGAAARLGWKDVLPYFIEERVRAAGAVIDSGEKYKPHVVQDGRLLTGQNAGSAAALAAALAQSPLTAGGHGRIAPLP